jgi:hypothetical protein
MSGKCATRHLAESPVRLWHTIGPQPFFRALRFHFREESRAKMVEIG